MRTIDLVERQLAIAIKKQQPRVIAKLEKELAELKANRPVPIVLTSNKPIADTLDNRAAFAFYNL